MFEKYKTDIRVGFLNSEVYHKFSIKLEMSDLDQPTLELIAKNLMSVDKAEITLFYHIFIFNIITGNIGLPTNIMLEALPVYIVSCLQHSDVDTDYDEVKSKVNKYYVCEFVVQLMLYYHSIYLSTKDEAYYNAKIAIKSLIQNILYEDLNQYEVSFLTSLSDTVSEYIRSEIPPEEQRNDTEEMVSLNNDI